MKDLWVRAQSQLQTVFSRRVEVPMAVVFSEPGDLGMLLQRPESAAQRKPQ